MKLLKTHPFLSLVNSYVIDSPTKSSGKRFLIFYIISVVVGICLFLVFVDKVVNFLEPLFFNIVECQFVYSSFVPFMIYYKVEIRSSKFLGINTRLYNTQSEDSNNLKERKGIKYKVSKIQKDLYNISSELNQVLIGLNLGDLYISKRAINAYLKFDQSIKNEAYLNHLYDLFKDYCSSAPKYTSRKPDLRTGKIYTTKYFLTYSLPCFNYYHDLFYVDKVKKIPENIGELLTPIGLAYWAMDDGTKSGSGFHFCTHSFTFS